MNGELLSILEAIEREKGIDREVLLQAVEAALVSAAKKTVGRAAKEITVQINRQSGKISILSDGQEVPSGDFGRIAAQTAKQVIIQKIREAEREVIFNEFHGKVGDIVSGSVHRFEHGSIIIDVGRAEAILPKSERIPKEDYKQGDRVQAYVLDVQKSARGPQIILSRAHIGFLKGLFQLEVPEIFEGIVEIKSVAREPGDRSKIAVWSKNEKVDCVGSCVGMRGTRVKNIVRELHGEKIDIVRYNDDAKEYVAAALSPAQVSDIILEKEHKSAVVLVDDEQLSLAIGKRGQNVRLASKLTGWTLEIKSKTDMALAALPPVSELPGVGPVMLERLKTAGFTTVTAIAKAGVDGLVKVEGIGPKTAEKLVTAAKLMLEQAGIRRPAELVLPNPPEPVAAAPLVPDAPAAEEAVPESAPTSDEPRATPATDLGESTTPSGGSDAP